MNNLSRVRSGGYDVVLAGWIRSPGTSWLCLPKNRFCIMLHAIFMFHRGSNDGRPAPQAQRMQRWNGLPCAVRNYIRRQHVESWKQLDPETSLPWIDWIKVTGTETVKAGFGRPCPPNAKVNIFRGSHSDG